MRMPLLVLTLVAAVSLISCASPASREAERKRIEAGKMFAERCKSSGERINRVVTDVDSIFLMKLRPKGINYDDQFKLDDPYGRDLSGQGYIESMLKGGTGFKGQAIKNPDWPQQIGYNSVQAIDPVTGKRLRYTGKFEEPWQTDKSYLKGYMKFVLRSEPAEAEPPRYGVTYDDISTRLDREHWIAGSSLKVIDLQTKEVIAERIGYMYDPGQGNDSGGRSPWLMAASFACPSFFRYPGSRENKPGFTYQTLQTLDFVEKVLKPKQ